MIKAGDSKERNLNPGWNTTGAKRLFALTSLLIFTLFSCKKKTTTVDVGYDYYPDAVGTYLVYDVIEIDHDDAVSIHDTSVYQLKEQIQSTFIDGEGRTALRIERSKRDSSHLPWVISDVWVVTKTGERVEKTEENETFVRLTFPVRVGEEWDGNILNTQPEWEYEYMYVDQDSSVLGVSQMTAKVLQEDFRPGIFVDVLAYEVYARNIGLVNKHFRDLELYGDTVGLVATDIKKGTELYQTLIDYGVE